MRTAKVKINSIKGNEDNPRIIDAARFEKLCNSIKEFPEMLELRPIIVDENNIVLGGNMRLKACKEVGLKEIYIVRATKLTEQQKKEFIVKDNVGFGEWDWEKLAVEWDTEVLNDWGLEEWEEMEELDYSELDDQDLDSELEDMRGEVKKAILIEFELNDYENAKELVKFTRENGEYIGGMLIDMLAKNLKERIENEKKDT